MSLYENTELPDSIEPILAIRAWNIFHDNGQYFLSSCFQYNIIWPRESKLSALCLSDDPWMSSGIKHTAPIKDCDCGIYAIKKLPNEEELIPWDDKSIIGLAYVWGKIIEGDKGYRAQFCKPAALLEDGKKETKVLAQNYSVPLIKDLNFSEIPSPFNT